VAAEKAEWMAEDALLYHDDDRDGAVSLDEFVASVLKFDAVRRRLRSIKSTRDPAKLFAKERTWIEQHMCMNRDCPHLDQLDRDYRAKGFGRRAEL